MVSVFHLFVACCIGCCCLLFLQQWPNFPVLSRSKSPRPHLPHHERDHWFLCFLLKPVFALCLPTAMQRTVPGREQSNSSAYQTTSPRIVLFIFLPIRFCGTEQGNDGPKINSPVQSRPGENPGAVQYSVLFHSGLFVVGWVLSCRSLERRICYRTNRWESCLWNSFQDLFSSASGNR